jgi:dihydrofolate reductase
VALRQAFEAADGKDVRLGGGVATIQQYLQADLVDEMHVAIAPILLGHGERLWDNLAGFSSTYECVELVSSPAVVHARFALRGPTRE